LPPSPPLPLLVVLALPPVPLALPVVGAELPPLAEPPLGSPPLARAVLSPPMALPEVAVPCDVVLPPVLPLELPSALDPPPLAPLVAPLLVALGLVLPAVALLPLALPPADEPELCFTLLLASPPTASLVLLTRLLTSPPLACVLPLPEMEASALPLLLIVTLPIFTPVAAASPVDWRMPAALRAVFPLLVWVTVGWASWVCVALALWLFESVGVLTLDDELLALECCVRALRAELSSLTMLALLPPLVAPLMFPPWAANDSAGKVSAKASAVTGRMAAALRSSFSRRPGFLVFSAMTSVSFSNQRFRYCVEPCLARRLHQHEVTAFLCGGPRVNPRTAYRVSTPGRRVALTMSFLTLS